MTYRLRSRLTVIALICSLLLLASGGVAFAAFTAAVSAGQTVSSLSLDNPGSATATTADDCATIDVSWGPASNADSYRVQVKQGAGAWSDLGETDLTTLSDTTSYWNTTVYYRVFSRHAASGWEGTTPATTTGLTCGIGSVVDLSASHACSSVTLTWSAAANAVKYNVEVSENGAAWNSLATNLTTTSYTDTTQRSIGASVAYRVLPKSNSRSGEYSNVASIASWDNFRVTSITVADAAVPGALRAGDTINVTFSAPADPASLTVSSIHVKRGNPGPGLYLATVARDTTGIGWLSTDGKFFGATASYAGVVGWADFNRTWTWTSSVSGTTMGALSGNAFNIGSGVKCAADGSGLQSAPAPASVSGSW